MSLRRRAGWGLVLALAACHARPAPMPPPPAPPVPADVVAAATAGVADPGLRALLAEHWDWTMRTSPTWATELGDHRFDDQLPMRDAASVARDEAAERGFLARAQAMPTAGVDAADRITLDLFIGDLAAAVAAQACASERWSVSAGGGSLLGELSYLVELHHVDTIADGDHLLARLGQGARIIDDSIANLRAGLAEGRVAPAETLRRAIAQLDAELAKPVAEWSMTRPAREPSSALATWPEPARARFTAKVVAIAQTQLEPALRRLRAVFSDELLPHGRVGAAEGLSGLPDGARCYDAMILNHLGTPHAAQALHDLGLREVARTDAELAALGHQVLGTADSASTVARLRTDPALFFHDGAQIVDTATQLLARSRAAIPAFFGVLPRTDCVVSVIPDYEAPFSTMAYYRQPNPDGSKPGEYFVNTYQPETRPIYEFEALTWHESIPGHHLQLAIAQELGDLPAFRKYDGSTAFIEGWALYTERLADEMGLYSSDLARIGMVSFDAWRSTRLVVDTGLHALGWTRAEAEAFMTAHTALTPANISNEVDRYVTTPGQALAYKVGQLDILALRDEAKAALGDRFTLPAFHDVVLGAGAVTLPVLEARVRAWVASRRP